MKRKLTPTLTLLATLAASAGFVTTARAQTITQPAAIAAAPKKTMIEYRYAPLDYYFITARANEIATLDLASGWARTGEKFDVFINPVSAEQNLNGKIVASGTLPISRFAFPALAKNGTRYSHVYTMSPAENSYLTQQNPVNVTRPIIPLYEGIDGYGFPMMEDIAGDKTCRAQTTPLYRAYRGGANFPDDPNHRFTTNLTLYSNLVGSGWTADGIVACVPGSSATQVAWLSNVKTLIEPGIVNGAVNPSLAVTVWTPMSPVASNIGDNPDWVANLKNGNVKIVKTGEMAADINGIPRNVWYAIFLNPRGNGYCNTPVNAHDGSAAYYNDSRTSQACFTSPAEYLIGMSDVNTNKNGLLAKVKNLCYLTTIVRGSEAVTCPL